MHYPFPYSHVSLAFYAFSQNPSKLSTFVASNMLISDFLLYRKAQLLGTEQKTIQDFPLT
jgi:hypothetical protein